MIGRFLSCKYALDIHKTTSGDLINHTVRYATRASWPAWCQIPVGKRG